MRHDPARVLSLRVPPGLRPRLDSIARDRGTSRHRAAVEALTAGLDAIERPASPEAATEGGAPGPTAAPATPAPPPPPSPAPRAAWTDYLAVRAS